MSLCEFGAIFKFFMYNPVCAWQNMIFKVVVETSESVVKLHCELCTDFRLFSFAMRQIGPRFNSVECHLIENVYSI